MHELWYAGAPAAAGAWFGARAWMARRKAPLGQHIAGFALPGTDGQVHSLESISSPVVVLLFMSNRCPGVKAYDGRMKRMMARYGNDVAVVGINPIEEGMYPGEGIAGMRRAMAERGLAFMYLKDEAQSLTHELGAICTPEVVVLDGERRIRYRGRIDDSLVEANARRHYLKDAIEATLKGRPPRIAETAPLGCSIDSARANPIVQGAAAT